MTTKAARTSPADGYGSAPTACLPASTLEVRLDRATYRVVQSMVLPAALLLPVMLGNSLRARAMEPRRPRAHG